VHPLDGLARLRHPLPGEGLEDLLDGDEELLAVGDRQVEGREEHIRRKADRELGDEVALALRREFVDELGAAAEHKGFHAPDRGR
jgi:hypothetical protein